LTLNPAASNRANGATANGDLDDVPNHRAHVDAVR
jgi:hypothetical protein